mgnify:FL=1
MGKGDKIRKRGSPETTKDQDPTVGETSGYSTKHNNHNITNGNSKKRTQNKTKKSRSGDKKLPQQSLKKRPTGPLSRRFAGRINNGNRKWWSLGIILFMFFMKYLQKYNESSKPLPFKSASNAKLFVENTFLDSWGHYVEDAFGYDMYHPLNPVGERGSNMLSNEKPLGWFIVDSVDSLMVMYNNTESNEHKVQFGKEIERCEKWIDSKLDYDIDHDNLNVFETTIRMLGGLLGAYYMSNTYHIGNSSVYLNKAIDLGTRLSYVYSNGKSIPLGKINLHSGSSSLEGNSRTSSLAEFTTLQLEFKYLHTLRPDLFPQLWEQSEACYDVIEANNDLYGPRWQGLVPLFIDPVNGQFKGQTIRLGSRADSYYEYLIKQYIFSPTNQTEHYHRFIKSMNGVKNNLLGQTPKRRGKHNGGLVFISEKNHGLSGPLSSKFDHLVCFIGGSLMLGATKGVPYKEAKEQEWWSEQCASDWKLGLEITRTCYNMYSENDVTGLAPEIAVFNSNHPEKFEELKDPNLASGWWSSRNNDFFIKPNDAHNLQRPETVESIFYAYQFTKSQTFRKWNWSILKSFIRSGSICLQDVTREDDNKMNNVESFWFSETLKYIYMTFLDDVDLSSIVFNTEAHIFPTLKSPNELDN